jgi:hypothetical protein
MSDSTITEVHSIHYPEYWKHYIIFMFTFLKNTYAFLILAFEQSYLKFDCFSWFYFEKCIICYVRMGSLYHKKLTFKT